MDLTGKCLGDTPQAVISRLMAIYIIKLFKEINIAENYPQNFPFPFGPLPLASQNLIEFTPVGNLRQTVNMGQVIEGLIGPFQSHLGDLSFGDVSIEENDKIIIDLFAALFKQEICPCRSPQVPFDENNFPGPQFIELR